MWQEQEQRDAEVRAQMESLRALQVRQSKTVYRLRLKKARPEFLHFAFIYLDNALGSRVDRDVFCPMVVCSIDGYLLPPRCLELRSFF